MTVYERNLEPSTSEIKVLSAPVWATQFPLCVPSNPQFPLTKFNFNRTWLMPCSLYLNLSVRLPTSNVLHTFPFDHWQIPDIDYIVKVIPSPISPQVAAVNPCHKSKAISMFPTWRTERDWLQLRQSRQLRLCIKSSGKMTCQAAETAPRWARDETSSTFL